uniref:Neuropeptides capa receptor n=1 Tax=Cacopsylla melanoneura TaxID=428564 RepID=A0A8D8UM52_9HEMI
MDYPFDFYDEKYHRKIEKLIYLKHNMTQGSNISNLILMELRKIVNQQLQDYTADRSKDFNETTSGEFFDQCDPLLSIIDLFSVYYIPVIAFVGLVGNALSCIVFLNTHLKLRSSSYYLAALAMADFSYLSVLLFGWSDNNMNLEVFNREGWCQTLVYLSSVFSFLSVWLIVAFTVERFIAVQYPLHRPHICTVARAKTVILCLTAASFLLHVYCFLTAGLVTNEAGVICDLREGYEEVMRYINILDTIVTLILPIVSIVVMNTMITRNLLIFGRRFRQEKMSLAITCSHLDHNHLHHSHSSSTSGKSIKNGVDNFHGISRIGSRHSSCNSGRILGYSTQSTVVNLAPTVRMSNLNHDINHNAKYSGSNLVSTRTQQSITKMLLLISTVFIILNLPSYLIRLYVFVKHSLYRQATPPLMWCLQQFFMHLYYTNFSINFLLYSMCGITFRKCLYQLMRNVFKRFVKP